MLKGTPNYSVANLESESNSFWREINPSAKSCASLIKLLEVYASQEEWEQIINLSSRAVLHLSKNYDRADFYHIWICALRETFDNGALISLGKHLVKMREFHPVFLSLSLIAFHFSSCKKTCNKIFNHLNKTKGVENRFAFEACGLYLASLKKDELNKKGFLLLNKVCLEKKTSYFSWRNYLRLLSEKNLLNEMSRTYNTIHEKFPFAQEPYLVASLIAMDSKNWHEAIRVLGQLIKDNPSNSNAILAMAQCYFEVGEYIKALSLLSIKSHIFLENDYDLHYLMGITLKKVVEKEFDSKLQDMSINHLEKSYYLANSLGFPLEAIQSEINEARALKSSSGSVKPQSDELNIMAIHGDNSKESEIVFEERKAS